MPVPGSPSSASTSEEDLILTMANDACRKLNLSRRINPRIIVWSRSVYSDECDLTAGFRRTGLVLPESLRGKLNGVEWEPILFAKLISFADGRRFLRMLYRLAFILLAIAGIGFMANVLLGPPWAILALPVAIFLIFLMLRDASKWLKRESLMLDGKTAGIVGNEVFLKMLRKISGMRLPDVEQLNERRGFTARVVMSGRPSLDERIRYLESNRQETAPD